MDNNTPHNNPLSLGVDKIPALLMRYALPSIIAMTAASLYNMVDSIFIGHGVGVMAISGLSLTLPMMNIAAAFGMLVGTGGATLLSVKLGQQDYKSAKAILGNVMVMNAIIGTLLTVVLLIFLDEILYIFGASENTLPYARDYMQIIVAGNIISTLFMGVCDMLRSSGYPNKAMRAILIAVLLNCVLDAIFIFVFKWGIRGAAIATVVAQIVSISIASLHFFKKSSFVRFERGCFTLKAKIVKGMFAIGMSPFLMNLCASGVITIINRSLQAHGGDMAIGAYGIVNRFFLFFIMVIMGLNQGMQPIAGYNFGAGNYQRLIQVYKYTVMCAVGVSTLGFLAGEIFPGAIASLFTTDQGLIDMARRGLRLVLVLFPLVGFQMVSANFFQSIGMASKAIFLSLSRQLIFLIPFLIIMPRYFGTDGVWISIPMADAMSVTITAILLFRQLKAFKKAKI